MNKKLLLINPAADVSRCTFWEPVSLGIIASLTPDHYDIIFIDENFEEFEFVDADLVAITSKTLSINRAYYISDLYRKKGIPTVIGGYHATLMPEEVSDHFDSVVIGEAEYSWKKVINDFENNSLKKKYAADHSQPQYIARPRRDIFLKYPYPAHVIETSRGCPNSCSFCATNAFYNSHYFERPVDDVIDELRSLNDKLIILADDNFIGPSENKARIIDLTKKIIDADLKINWMCFSTINIFSQDEVLELLKKSGCRLLFIGFESEKTESLSEVNKFQNIRALKDQTIKSIIRKIHTYKIAVMGGFIFGFDQDDHQSLENRVSTILGSGIDWYSFNILTPFPGTKLYETLRSENRITATNYPEDWKKYNFIQVVFEPKKLAARELDNFVQKQFDLYTCQNAFKNFIRTLFKTRSLRSACYMYIWYSHHWLKLEDCFILKNLVSFLYKVKYLQ